MKRSELKGYHEDDRGKIEDLLVTDDGAVTFITFKKGAVRGNHYHKGTRQTDFLLKGSLLCKTQYGEYLLGPGDSVSHAPYVKHAYKALEDSEMVTCAHGQRKGRQYDSDTFKLETPLL